VPCLPHHGSLGFDSVWFAEVSGSDAITPRACLAAVTYRVRRSSKAGFPSVSCPAAWTPVVTGPPRASCARGPGIDLARVEIQRGVHMDVMQRAGAGVAAQKPVIAQMRGYAITGGSELATACDLECVAQDARIGYAVVRMLSPPGMQFHTWLMGVRAEMEMMLTGDSISSVEAVAAGLANRAFPVAELEQAVVEHAVAVAKIPSDPNQLNKRSVHRAMDSMGTHTAI
jgi:enoyl-CoA hydratase/carnithine racemase